MRPPIELLAVVPGDGWAYARTVDGALLLRPPYAPDHVTELSATDLSQTLARVPSECRLTPPVAFDSVQSLQGYLRRASLRRVADHLTRLGAQGRRIPTLKALHAEDLRDLVAILQHEWIPQSRFDDVALALAALGSPEQFNSDPVSRDQIVSVHHALRAASPASTLGPLDPKEVPEPVGKRRLLALPARLARSIDRRIGPWFERQPVPKLLILILIALGLEAATLSHLFAPVRFVDIPVGAFLFFATFTHCAIAAALLETIVAQSRCAVKRTLNRHELFQRFTTAPMPLPVGKLLVERLIDSSCFNVLNLALVGLSPYQGARYVEEILRLGPSSPARRSLQASILSWENSSTFRNTTNEFTAWLFAQLSQPTEDASERLADQGPDNFYNHFGVDPSTDAKLRAREAIHSWIASAVWLLIAPLYGIFICIHWLVGFDVNGNSIFFATERIGRLGERITTVRLRRANVRLTRCSQRYRGPIRRFLSNLIDTARFHGLPTIVGVIRQELAFVGPAPLYSIQYRFLSEVCSKTLPHIVPEPPPFAIPLQRALVSPGIVSEASTLSRLGDLQRAEVTPERCGEFAAQDIKFVGNLMKDDLGTALLHDGKVVAVAVLRALEGTLRAAASLFFHSPAILLNAAWRSTREARNRTVDSDTLATSTPTEFVNWLIEVLGGYVVSGEELRRVETFAAEVIRHAVRIESELRGLSSTDFIEIFREFAHGPAEAQIQEMEETLAGLPTSISNPFHQSALV